MLELESPIIATQPLDAQRIVVTLGAPALAAAASAGQRVAVRAPGDAPIHRITVPFSAIDQQAGTVSFLWGGADEALRQRELRVGDTLNILGPIGHSWTVDAAARQLLLVGTTGLVGSLLALATSALRRHCAVTMVLGGPIGPGLPAGLVPADVEYHLGRGLDPAGAALDLLDDGTIRWADAIFAALPASSWSRLAQRVERTRVRWDRGLAQADAEMALPCAVGVCGVCELPVGRKARLVCVDGPIFDLRDLTRS